MEVTLSVQRSVGRSIHYVLSYGGFSGQIASITCITAPAHPHVTDAVVYTALFFTIGPVLHTFIPLFSSYLPVLLNEDYSCLLYHRSPISPSSTSSFRHCLYLIAYFPFFLFYATFFVFIGPISSIISFLNIFFCHLLPYGRSFFLSKSRRTLGYFFIFILYSKLLLQLLSTNLHRN